MSIFALLYKINLKGIQKGGNISASVLNYKRKHWINVLNTPFLPIFVADKKVISGYNFGTPLMKKTRTIFLGAYGNPVKIYKGTFSSAVNGFQSSAMAEVTYILSSNWGLSKVNY